VVLRLLHEAGPETEAPMLGQHADLQNVEVKILPGGEEIGDQATGRVHQDALKAPRREQLGEKELTGPGIVEASPLGNLETADIARLRYSLTDPDDHAHASPLGPWIGGPST
jgi:hypothetical protein